MDDQRLVVGAWCLIVFSVLYMIGQVVRYIVW